MTVTKADLVDEVYKSFKGMSKTQAADSVETFLSLSKSTLIEGKDLLISGFGKFKVKDKKSRKGRNPQTGLSMILEGRRVITFSPSMQLRNKVNAS